MLDTEKLLIAKSGLVIGWFALFFILERLAPASPWKAEDADFSQARHWRNNFTLWLCNLLLSRVLVLPVTLTAAVWGQRFWAGLDVTLPWATAPWSPLIAIPLLDLWIYWWHRFNHELPFLWRFHQVHHLDQQLDSTTALRFHLGEVALSAFARAPVIVLLGLSLDTVLVFETLVLLAAIFHHSNVRLATPVENGLSRLLITPAIHWVHHHAVREDTDSNYGTLFSFWDRIFGSVGPGTRTPDMTLGLAGIRENRIGALLAVPFGWKRQ